jgi:hypothetical protein
VNVASNKLVAIGYTHIKTCLGTKIDENSYRNLFFTDINATDDIFTDIMIIIHAEVLSVNVMSVIIMSEKVFNLRFAHASHHHLILKLYSGTTERVATPRQEESLLRRSSVCS